MAFVLRSVCRECYALELQGNDVGIAFRHEDGKEPWVVALYDRKFPVSAELPPPFLHRQYSFATLRELRDWLRGSRPGGRSALAAAEAIPDADGERGLLARHAPLAAIVPTSLPDAV